ncbi:hypothetical protein [Mesorhizobium sp.]|uniref:hypothetical protein n=1 Tax=Mesorhizobium sp. TaxID=1871066 RepID=UPI0025D53B82|nr:hypothetical protein [Mesorhizobium sp.]
MSNFINGTASLKEGTRDRIEKAVAALMYRPSSFARSLPGRAPRRPKNLDHLPRLLVAGRGECRLPVPRRRAAASRQPDHRQPHRQGAGWPRGQSRGCRRRHRSTLRAGR